VSEEECARRCGRDADCALCHGEGWHLPLCVQCEEPTAEGVCAPCSAVNREVAAMEQQQEQDREEAVRMAGARLLGSAEAVAEAMEYHLGRLRLALAEYRQAAFSPASQEALARAVEEVANG
jgi:hypothetical protein